jgi:hypothetical protein
VCGCDSITYWNDSLAAKNGMSVASRGSCASGSQPVVTCGGTPAVTCPTPAVCNLQVKNVAGCVSGAHGTCWVVPATCPSIGGSKLRVCGSLTCGVTQCNLLNQQATYFEDGSCPN